MCVCARARPLVWPCARVGLKVATRARPPPPPRLPRTRSRPAHLRHPQEPSRLLSPGSLSPLPSEAVTAEAAMALAMKARCARPPRGDGSMVGGSSGGGENSARMVRREAGRGARGAGGKRARLCILCLIRNEEEQGVAARAGHYPATLKTVSPNSKNLLR